MLYTAKGVAAIIGPYVGAVLADKYGWALGFYGSAIMALIAAMMAVRLRSVSAALKAAKLQAAIS